MSLNVVNNFLDNDEFWKISKTVMANNFPWFLEGDSFSHHLIKPLDDGKYENSFFISLVLNKITEKIKPKKILKAYLNLTSKTNKEDEIDKQREPINLNNKNYVGFFFINTCNGKIQISGGNEIDTIENRFVTFPINTAYFHSSHTDKQLKIFLKIVYTPN
tara:strand:+ start:156 stop:638 length:483 start_codon:yes stop_codon:yes gene_type:complete